MLSRWLSINHSDDKGVNMFSQLFRWFGQNRTVAKPALNAFRGRRAGPFRVLNQKGSRRRVGCRPGIEELENRTVPAVAIQFDYSLDTGGMFDNPAAKGTLAAAARNVAGYLETPLNATAFGSAGLEDYYLKLSNPRTGEEERRDNVTVPANSLVVHIGGRDLPAGTLGTAKRDGFGCHHNNHLCIIGGVRAEFAGWGGTITFDTNGTNWYFGSSEPVPQGSADFYSVAVHELGHLLGIGSSPKWASLVSGGAFRGSNAMQRYGGPVPVDEGADHFREGVSDPDPQFGEVSMDPTTPSDARKEFTPLDFAALADLGWAVTYDPNSQRHYGDVINPLGINNDFSTIVAGDFNGDRHDVLFFYATYPGDGTNRWFFGRPDNTFGMDQNLVAGRFEHVAVGDFDGNGRDDLFFHNGNGNHRWFYSFPPDFSQDNDETQKIPTGLVESDTVVAGDFDGNGRDDLLFRSLDGASKLFYSLPDGSYRRSMDDVIGGGDRDDTSGFTRVVVGDFNADQRDDVLFYKPSEGSNRWFFSRGDWFDQRADRITPEHIIGSDHLVAGDFDGDGDDDLLFHRTGDGANRWYVSGDPNLEPERQDERFNRAAIDLIYDHLVAGDFNGDGVADAFFHDTESGWNILAPNVPPPPAAPVITGYGDDTGAAGDNLTGDNTITLQGTATSGLTIRVFDGPQLLGTTMAGTGGAWSFTTNTLADGAHSLHAVAVGAGGVSSPASAVLNVRVDARAPSVLRATPSSTRLTAADVGSTFTLTVGFSEPMDTAVAPAISFSADLLSLLGGSWADATTYVASYLVLGTDVNVSEIAVGVTGARDVTGNPQTVAIIPNVVGVNHAPDCGGDITAEQLRKIMPRLSPGRAAQYLPTSTVSRT